MAEPRDKTFSHIDEAGGVRMVDVSGKASTTRVAMAEAVVELSANTMRLLRERALPKGDVLTCAKIAGIMAAKRTSELIPMCHPISLTQADVRFHIEGNLVQIICETRTTGPTGVEMEAIVGSQAAAATIYDMCKAVQRDIIIRRVRLLRKEGGRSGVYQAPDMPLPRTQELSESDTQGRTNESDRADTERGGGSTDGAGPAPGEQQPGGQRDESKEYIADLLAENQRLRERVDAALAALHAVEQAAGVGRHGEEGATGSAGPSSDARGAATSPAGGADTVTPGGGPRPDAGGATAPEGGNAGSKLSAPRAAEEDQGAGETVSPTEAAERERGAGSATRTDAEGGQGEQVAEPETGIGDGDERVIEPDSEEAQIVTPELRQRAYDHVDETVAQIRSAKDADEAMAIGEQRLWYDILEPVDENGDAIPGDPHLLPAVVDRLTSYWGSLADEVEHIYNDPKLTPEQKKDAIGKLDTTFDVLASAAGSYLRILNGSAPPQFFAKVGDTVFVRASDTQDMIPGRFVEDAINHSQPFLEAGGNRINAILDRLRSGETTPTEQAPAPRTVESSQVAMAVGDSFLDIANSTANYGGVPNALNVFSGWRGLAAPENIAPVLDYLRAVRDDPARFATLTKNSQEFLKRASLDETAPASPAAPTETEKPAGKKPAGTTKPAPTSPAPPTEGTDGKRCAESATGRDAEEGQSERGAEPEAGVRSGTERVIAPDSEEARVVTPELRKKATELVDETVDNLLAGLPDINRPWYRRQYALLRLLDDILGTSADDDGHVRGEWVTERTLSSDPRVIPAILDRLVMRVHEIANEIDRIAADPNRSIMQKKDEMDALEAKITQLNAIPEVYRILASGGDLGDLSNFFVREESTARITAEFSAEAINADIVRAAAEHAEKATVASEARMDAAYERLGLFIPAADDLQNHFFPIRQADADGNPTEADPAAPTESTPTAPPTYGKAKHPAGIRALNPNTIAQFEAYHVDVLVADYLEGSNAKKAQAGPTATQTADVSADMHPAGIRRPNL